MTDQPEGNVYSIEESVVAECFHHHNNNKRARENYLDEVKPMIKKHTIKRKKKSDTNAGGLHQRVIQKQLKDHGKEYVNRKGSVVPAKQFAATTNCCRKRCDERCTPELQEKMFNSFYEQSKDAQEQILYSGIVITDKKGERKGRGKNGRQHSRLITAKYQLKIENARIDVCKKMYQTAYGISKGKIAVLLQKLRASGPGFPKPDERGRHEPKNKMNEIKTIMRAHIEQYKKCEGNSKAASKYLPSHLNIKTMYNDYKQTMFTASFESCGSYQLFRCVFSETGYKFKPPKKRQN